MKVQAENRLLHFDAAVDNAEGPHAFTHVTGSATASLFLPAETSNRIHASSDSRFLMRAETLLPCLSRLTVIRCT
jgi:hypothetical protein